MKKLLLVSIAASLALTQVLRANNNQDQKKHKRHVAAQAADQGPVQQRAAAPAQSSRTQVRHAAVQQPSHTVTPVQNRAVSHRTTAKAVTAPSKPATKVTNVTSNNRNSNRNFNRNSFATAKSRVIVVRHNRGWWVNRYPHTRFVLFGGGYYYWDAGYWYPAFGYSPIYSNYAYNEPIYGYNNLAPGQVIYNVQEALRNQGYYRGSIDGLVGPGTRGALASYQRDHGLVVTEAIDEPTLVTLGLA